MATTILIQSPHQTKPSITLISKVLVLISNDKFKARRAVDRTIVFKCLILKFST
jgi:hypothetical protein